MTRRAGRLLPRWGLDSHPLLVRRRHGGGRRGGEANRAWRRDNTILDRFAAEAGEESTYIHFDSSWGMDLELISNPQPGRLRTRGRDDRSAGTRRGPTTWAGG